MAYFVRDPRSSDSLRGSRNRFWLPDIFYSGEIKIWNIIAVSYTQVSELMIKCRHIANFDTS